MLSFAVTKVSLLGIIRKQKNISCCNDHHSNRHNVFALAYHLYQPTVQLHSPPRLQHYLVLHHSKPRNQLVKYHPIANRSCSMFDEDQSKNSTMFQLQAVYLVIVLPLLTYESMQGNQNIVCQKISGFYNSNSYHGFQISDQISSSKLSEGLCLFILSDVLNEARTFKVKIMRINMVLFRM